MRVSPFAAAVLLCLAAHALTGRADNGSYEGLLEKLADGAAVDGLALRNAWAESSHFDPYYVVTLEYKRFIESMADALPADLDGDLSAVQTRCTTIPPEFFIDMRTHIDCVNLAEAADDSRAAAFHLRVFDGILDSIAKSGDGLTVGTAYQVVSAVEAWEYLARTGHAIEEFGAPTTEAATAVTVRDEAGRKQKVWFKRHAKFAGVFNPKRELALRQLAGIDN